MENATHLGMNRTGLQMAPLNGTGMVDYADEKAGQVPPDDGGYEQMHRAYVEEADSVGSVPVPGTVKGMLKSGAQKLMGTRPEVLVDKLGERLAFERGGVRLYDAMIMKVLALQTTGMESTDARTRARGQSALDDPDTDAYESPAAGGAGDGQVVSARVDLATLQRIREDEQAHFRMVKEAIEELGADPTAMTPCADVVGVTSMGLIQTLSDPRTNIAQCLNALLTAELTDNAGWELLMELAEELGHDDMAVRFSVAATAEAEHLAIVKEWLRSEIMEEAA
ncbi:MAG: ferritin-like domain-containing protein [Pseudomonadota bacterium]